LGEIEKNFTYNNEAMTNLNDYSKRVNDIEKTGKFPNTSIEQKLLGVYNGVSAFSNTVNRDDKKDIEKRLGAIFVNLLSIANSLSIDPDVALGSRISEIEECHGTCEKK
jgi:hypothetical protein